VAEAKSFFDAAGYTGLFLLGRRLVPIAKFDATRHQNQRSLDVNKHVLFNAEYVDSFVFAHDHKMVEKLSRIADLGSEI
jgi:hypothetical protein